MKNKNDNIWYNGIEGIKKSGVDVSHLLDDDIIKELFKSKIDAKYFIENYIKLVDQDTGDVVPFILRDYQNEMIDGIINNRFTITMMARRMGKTSTCSALFLWYATFNKNFKALILANNQKKSQEIIEDIQMMILHLPLWIQEGIKEWNKSKIVFENGAIIEARATTPNSGRGSGNSIVYVDELAFIQDSIVERFLRSSFPSILSSRHTKMIITSTPQGKNYFYKLYTEAQNGKNVFKSMFFPWWKHPLYDEKFKQYNINTYGDLYWRQEFQCVFDGSAPTLIKGHILERLTTINPIEAKEILNPDYILNIYQHPDINYSYYLTLDLGEGLGLDYTAINVIKIEYNKWVQVATFYNNEIDVDDVSFVVSDIARFYNNAFIIGENNVFPHVYDDILEKCEYDNIYFHDDGRIGVRQTQVTRTKGLNQLVKELECGRLEICDSNLISEMNRFIKKGKKYQADEGCHDDMIMSLSLFCWFISDEDRFHDHIKNNMRFRKDIKDLDIEEVPMIGYDNGIVRNLYKGLSKKQVKW